MINRNGQATTTFGGRAKAMSFCLSAVLVAASIRLAAAAIIPPERCVDWIPGVTVGVRGGIPQRTNLIDVTKSPYNADNTGARDASVAINAAINAAQSNDVVYIPDGRYILSNAVIFTKSYITIRGHTNSVLIAVGSSGYLIKAGGDRWNYNLVPSNTITNGATKGSTNIVLDAVPSNFAVGDQISISENSTSIGSETFPVMNVRQYDHVILQQLVVTGINDRTVTLSAPLVFDFTNSPVVIDAGPSTKGVGIENLIITSTNTLTGKVGNYNFLLAMSMCYDSWITGCSVQWANNYGIGVGDSSHLLIGHNSVQHALSSGSNHSGLLVGDDGECLFEDNIICDGLQPAIEFNGGFCGNAVFANLLTNNIMDIDNHGPHPMMNLWEANDMGGSFEMDGYFGSGSHQTLFRNAIRSEFVPLFFKRWTTFMNVVGNVLGRPGNSYSNYTHEVNGLGWQIIEMGYPNIGNEGYQNTSPPVGWNYPGTNFTGYDSLSYANGIFTFTNNQANTTNLVGNFTNVASSLYNIVFQDNNNTNLYYPTNGGPITAVSVGTSSNLYINRPFTVQTGWKVFVSGQVAYQQLQKSEKYSQLITGNYDYYNHAVTWDTNGVQAVPPSLLYTAGAPWWWGTRRWPAVDPQSGPLITSIPAQERYLISVGQLANRPLPPGGMRVVTQ